MTCEFLSGLTKLPPVTATIGTGTIGSTGTLYLFLAGRNRAGWTVASDPTVVNYTPNSSITVNIPTAARGDGTNFIRYALSANTSNDPLTSIQIGEWENYELDQITPRTLNPIVLTIPQQIELGTTIATPALLPTGADLINGMHRLITAGLPNGAAASYYKYSQFETRAAINAEIIEPNPGEKWVRVLSPFTGQITDAFGVGGCALDVRQIDPTYVIAPPFYNPNQPNPVKGTPIKLVWRNNSTIALKAGTSFGLQVRQGLENHTDLFNGKLILALKGYTDGLGGLDRSDGLGGYLPFVDVDRVWAYDDDAIGILTLDRDLGPGAAVVWEISPYFTAQQFQGSLASGELISIYLYPYSQSGKLVKALGAITGDLILPTGNRLHPVPELGLAITVGIGTAIVKSYSFEKLSPQTVLGLAANTPNQKLCIDGNGICSIRSAPLTSEAILALISTEAGETAIGTASPPISMVSNGAASLLITHPSYLVAGGTIRANYPVIGGGVGKFNPTSMRLYARSGTDVFPLLVNGSNIVAATHTPTQTVTATELGAIVTLPTVDPLLGFFIPPTAVGTALPTGGTIPAGNYEILISYDYNGSTISKIDRIDSSVIPESQLSIAQIGALNQAWGNGISNLADLRLIPADNVPLQQRLTPGGVTFYFDPTSTLSDNNATIFKPTYLTDLQPGRWQIKTAGSGSGLPPWTQLGGGGNTTIPADGGRFSVNLSFASMTLILPVNPTQHTEVSYQIIDTTTNDLFIIAQNPNVLSGLPIGGRVKHNPAGLRSGLETWRFVSGTWIPTYGRTIIAALAPVNNNFADRTILTGQNLSIVANNTGATFELGEPPHLYDGAPDGTSIWWSWTPAHTGSVTMNAIGSGIDVVLGIYQPNVPGQTDLTLGILFEAGNLFTGGAATPVTFVATAGLEYIVAVTGYLAVSGEFTLKIDQAAVNDNFANRTIISGQSAVIIANNLAATYEPNEPTHVANGNSSLWWTWTPGVNGTVTITGVSTQNGLVLAVYTGTDLVAGLTLVQQQSFSAPGGFPADTPVSFYANSGTEYQLAVAGYLGGTDNFTLTLDQIIN